MINKILVVFLILTSFMLMFLSERPLYFAAPLWVILIALCYNDYKIMKLPNLLNAAVLVLGIVFHIHEGSNPLIPFTSFIIGLLSLFGISVLYSILRKKQGLGMGDVKLFAAGAIWLSPYMLPLVMLISSLGAIIFAILFWPESIAKKLERKIPFGPFLAMAIWTVWLFEDHLLLLIG